MKYRLEPIRLNFHKHPYLSGFLVGFVSGFGMAICYCLPRLFPR